MSYINFSNMFQECEGVDIPTPVIEREFIKFDEFSESLNFDYIEFNINEKIEAPL